MTKVSNLSAHARRASESVAGDRVTPPRKSSEKKPPENLYNLQKMAAELSLTRRPPKLTVNGIQKRTTSSFDEVLLEEIRPVSGVTTGELAYSVAELVIRREKELSETGDDHVKEGLATLLELARMFEHLAILQTG